HSAVLRADGRAEESQLLHLLDQDLWVAIGVVVFEDARLDLIVHPSLERLQQLLLFIGVERHGACSRARERSGHDIHKGSALSICDARISVVPSLWGAHSGIVQ